MKAIKLSKRFHVTSLILLKLKETTEACSAPETDLVIRITYTRNMSKYVVT